MGHVGVCPPPLSAQEQGQPAAAIQQQQQLGGRAENSWAGNDSSTLLVVATLITTLTYQLGTCIPGGYWQQDVPRSPEDSTVMYRAGDPIMRDLHRPRYWLFMAASWVGFASSMVMTLSLLVRMGVYSRHVRWSFAVAFLIWVGVVAFLWITVSLRPDRRVRAIQALRCGGSENETC